MQNQLIHSIAQGVVLDYVQRHAREVARANVKGHVLEIALVDVAVPA